MPVTLTAYKGRAALEIADHKGEVFLYLFVPVSIPSGWAVRLAKVDPETGEPEVEYTVSNARGDWWECGCNDWKYRRKQRNEQGGCKHILHAKELRALLSAMTGAST